MDNDVEASLKG